MVPTVVSVKSVYGVLFNRVLCSRIQINMFLPSCYLVFINIMRVSPKSGPYHQLHLHLVGMKLLKVPEVCCCCSYNSSRVGMCYLGININTQVYTHFEHPELHASDLDVLLSFNSM